MSNMYVVQYHHNKLNAEIYENYLSFRQALKCYIEWLDTPDWNNERSSLKIICNDKDITAKVNKFISEGR